MNGLPKDVDQIHKINSALQNETFSCDLLLCVPNPLIAQFATEAEGNLMIGAEDCHQNISGAHTGDVSAELLKAVGAKAIIVGHSERRADHHETSALVAQKAKAAQHQGLTPIICVGETLEERDAGKAIEIVTKQMKESLEGGVCEGDYVIAYEPVWAIGTGRIPSNDDITAMHDALRDALKDIDGVKGENIQLLYGGSVKPSNAKEILAIENVNGALIGGASLKAEDFLSIARQ